MVRAFRLPYCLLLIGLLFSTVSATTLVRMSNEDLALEADLIAIGRCTESRSAWVEGQLVTLVTFDVSEVLKGVAGRSVTVAVPGGIDAQRKHPIARVFPGAVRFMDDQEAFLFLDETAGAYSILGFSQGAFSIVKAADGARLVARDLSRVQLVSSAGSEKGGQEFWPLSDFKNQIRDVLQSSPAPGNSQKKRRD